MARAKSIKAVKTSNPKIEAPKASNEIKEEAEEVEETINAEKIKEEIEDNIGEAINEQSGGLEDVYQSSIKHTVSEFNKHSDAKDMIKINNTVSKLADYIVNYDVVNITGLDKESIPNFIDATRRGIEDAAVLSPDKCLTLPLNTSDELLLTLWIVLTTSYDMDASGLANHVEILTKLDMLHMMTQLGKKETSVVFKEMLQPKQDIKKLEESEGIKMNDTENTQTATGTENIEKCFSPKVKTSKEEGCTNQKGWSTTTKVIVAAAVAAVAGGVYYAHQEGYLDAINPFGSVDTTEVEEAVELM